MSAGPARRIAFRPPARSLGLVVPLLVALLMMAPAQGAGPATHPLQPQVARTHSTIVWNCSSQRSAAPVLPRSTLTGGWNASVRAHACPAARAGPSADSYAQDIGTLWVEDPVTLNASDHGVRLSWDLDFDARTSTAFGATVLGCPFYSTNYTFVNASGVYRYRFEYQWCDVEAVIGLSGSTELVDLTTGAVVTAAHAWKGFALDSGIQTITYGYFGNYSNPRYWVDNYTDWVSYNYTFGNLSSATRSLTPTWWMNGTFITGQRYALETQVAVSIAAESFMYHGGRAAVSFDALGPSRGFSVGPVVVY